MAKWGEGDPRWIVEERSDATNVNNWHWTEKNCTSWSIEKITSLLNQAVIVDTDEYKVTIDSIPTLSGDISASNRKGKVILFYEMQLKLRYKGLKKSDSSNYDGEMEVPNFSDEYDMDELELNVTPSSLSPTGTKLKDIIRKAGLLKIQSLLKLFFTELKSQYCGNMILPTAKPQSSTAVPAVSVSSSNKSASVNTTTPVSKSESKFDLKTYTTTLEFKCSMVDAYDVLVNPNKVKAWTRDSVMQLSPEINGEFKLLSGNISGKFTKLTPPNTIQMAWRLSSYPVGHFSTVNISFAQKQDATELTLVQSAIPAACYEMTVNGWAHNYWKSINAIFGYGANFGDF